MLSVTSRLRASDCKTAGCWLLKVFVVGDKRLRSLGGPGPKRLDPTMSTRHEVRNRIPGVRACSLPGGVESHLQARAWGSGFRWLRFRGSSVQGLKAQEQHKAK